MKLKNRFILILRRSAYTIVIIAIFLLVGSVVHVSANVATQKFINSQYQNKQQGALITNAQLTRIQHLQNWSQKDRWALVFNQRTQKGLTRLLFLAHNRQQNDQTIRRYYDGRFYYANQVNTTKLDQTDNRLLLERNQTIYQRQKNHLDQIRIWYDQTQDAVKFLRPLLRTYHQETLTLSFEQVSQANAYYKLIKNRRLKQTWQPQVADLTKTFRQQQKNQDATKRAQEKAELAALKNAPLSQSYTPAKVTILDSFKAMDQASQDLMNNHVNATTVLFYASAQKTLTLMQRKGDRYTAASAAMAVQASSIASGSYKIAKVVTNPPSTAGIVTQPSQDNFGQYVADATNISSETNTETDFNQARPIFWLKNNPAFQTAILFNNGSTLGFIVAGSTLNNTITISSGDLLSIISSVNDGITLYVS